MVETYSFGAVSTGDRQEVRTPAGLNSVGSKGEKKLRRLAGISDLSKPEDFGIDLQAEN